MTEQEELFVATVDDIKEKLGKGDKYSIIRSSGLLRQLLVDGECLVDIVNKPYRLKIEFETTDFTFQLPAEFRDLIFIAWETIDPSILPPSARKIRINKDKFLGAKCCSLEGRVFTVKDIIKACAHGRGGVHSGKAKAEVQEVLDFDEILKLGGAEPSLLALAGILRVTLAALEPLVNHINKAQASPGN